MNQVSFILQPERADERKSQTDSMPHAGRRNVSFTHTTPINSRGKKQPHGVF